jgi:hypothetical protein
MELLISPTALGLCGLVAALLVLAANALRFKVDPREPPVVYPKIPLVGHIIGLMTDGATYSRSVLSVY